MNKFSYRLTYVSKINPNVSSILENQGLTLNAGFFVDSVGFKKFYRAFEIYFFFIYNQ